MARYESTERANYKYRAKTYRMINVKLRLEDDADILEDIDKAKENGVTYREWLRELFDNQK